QNGMVLVAGGADSNGTVSASAELYDPASGTWSATGSLNTARAIHTATLLQNGMVLVAGGFDDINIPLAIAELYDPASGTWAATGIPTFATRRSSELLIGIVLVAGGAECSGAVLASAELYNPASGTWTLTGSLNTARYYHTATLLPKGEVLVAGGVESSTISA